MSYKYFGRLAGKTHTARKSLTESAPPNTLTPFNPQAPATKLLAYGEDATSLAFNRALSALSANVDYVASVLDAPALRREIIRPSRHTADGDWTEGGWSHGCVSLGESGSGGLSTGEDAIHIPSPGPNKVPSYWVHLGLHKTALGERVKFFRTQNQSLGGPTATGKDVNEEHVEGTPNPEITGHALATVHHIAKPDDAFLNFPMSAGSLSYFDFTYKLQGTQHYLGNEEEGLVNHIPPIERMKPNMAPYNNDWHSEQIYKWDTDGVYLKSITFSQLNLRPGCYVEISSDGDEDVNKGNNGLFQIASITRSDHVPSSGGPGDKAILTRGGLCKVTVRDWRMFGRGELVSWASAPNHMDQTADTALKPGLRKNYAHVAYIIPRPDIEGNPTDEPGDLYLARYNAGDDNPHPQDGAGYKAGRADVVNGEERYSGRYKHGDIGSPDQESFVRDHNGAVIMDALQNHGILPGTRLYHGHAHFYPSMTPWGMDPAWASPYSEVMGELDAVPDGIVGPGEPVVFDTMTVPGKVWPCSPSGFVLNPSFSFPEDNELYVGEYYADVHTLTTVKEKLSADSITKAVPANPEESILRAWHKFVRTGHLSGSNAPAWGTGHTSGDTVGIAPPKSDDLNVLGTPTKKILGGDLWHVKFEWVDVGVHEHASFEEVYESYLTNGGQAFVGDFAGYASGGDLKYHPIGLWHPIPGFPQTGVKFSSISGNHAVLYDVNMLLDTDNVHQDWDGWEYGRETWPITEDCYLFIGTAEGDVKWRISEIVKAPWVDDSIGRGKIPSHGLNSLYNNDYSSSPYLRGPNIIGTSAHGGGTGNVLWINPKRPFTTVLPGGDTLLDGNDHADGWTNAHGEIAHLTRSNNDLYISLHRLVSRGAPGTHGSVVRAELAVRHATTAAMELTDSTSDGVPNATGTRVFSEQMLSGPGGPFPLRSTKMLLTDPTTGDYGNSPEIGPFTDTDIGLNEMHSTDKEGGYPKHGVYLSNNLSKVKEESLSDNAWDDKWHKLPTFDHRSTPREVQDRSILGAIEGTLLGHFTPFSNNHPDFGDGGRGDLDTNSFGTFSNGVISGGVGWIEKMKNNTGAPDDAASIPDLNIRMEEAYFHVGGAKWYVPRQDIVMPANSGTWLVSWSPDTRKYEYFEIHDSYSGTPMGWTAGISNDKVNFQKANNIPLYVAEMSAFPGSVLSLTDIRFRVSRQDQKNSIYVGQVNPRKSEADDSARRLRTNGGYIDDSMNFKTLSEALRALDFWCRGTPTRHWTIEIVGSTYEYCYDPEDAGLADNHEHHGIEYPVRIPVNGLTIRGLPGRNPDRLDKVTGTTGWDAGSKFGGAAYKHKEFETPVVHYSHPLAKPVPGLFDLNGKFGLTFENISFKYCGDMDNIINKQGDWAADVRDVPQDVIFCAGNYDYERWELVDVDDLDYNHDRENFDNLYGGRNAPTNAAYTGGWTFRNIYIQDGGGLLTTLDAKYSIDNIVVENCQANSVLSFVTLGIDTSDLPGDQEGRGNGKHICRVSIKNNSASFPATNHKVNGQPGSALILGPLTTWVPNQGDDLFGEYYTENFGANGPGTIGKYDSKYMCGVYATQCKEIVVENNTFKSFYCGVVFGKPLKLDLTPEPGYNFEPYCEGIITSNVIQNTQSHGVVCFSGASCLSNISVTDNVIKDPGAPHGASNAQEHPNIFEWESWGIYAYMRGAQITGNKIYNEWRVSPESNWTNGGPNAGFDWVDRSGIEYATRMPCKAGGIWLQDANSGATQSEANIISDNHISLGGRALYGVLLSSYCERTVISNNVIEYKAAKAGIAADAPDYNDTDFAEMLGKYPWSVFVSRYCDENIITDNVLGANIWLDKNCDNSIVSGNIIRAPYKLTNPVASGQGGCLLRVAAWGTTISNNKLHCGMISVGADGAPATNTSIVGNDLTPFGSVMWPVNNAGPIKWMTGIFVNGGGVNILIDGNITNGGNIKAEGTGPWHNMRIVNNVTGMLPVATNHPDGYGGLIPGGNISIELGDGCTISGNSTYSGYISVGNTSNLMQQTGGDIIPGSPNDCNNASIVNNKTYGGTIYAMSHGFVIAHNDVTRGLTNFGDGDYSTDFHRGKIRVFDGRDGIISDNIVGTSIDAIDTDLVKIDNNKVQGGIYLLNSPNSMVSNNTCMHGDTQQVDSTTAHNLYAYNCSGLHVHGNRFIPSGLTENKYGYINYIPHPGIMHPYAAGAAQFNLYNTNSQWADGGDGNVGSGTPPPLGTQHLFDDIKGIIYINSCPDTTFTSNHASKIEFLGDCARPTVSDNFFLWGGAWPCHLNNKAITMGPGAYTNFTISNNRCMGSIWLKVDLDGVATGCGEDHMGSITGNKVGTYLIQGTEHIVANAANSWGGSGPWRGGGGLIICDAPGGVIINGNSLCTQKGQMFNNTSDYNNDYDGREYGFILMNMKNLASTRSTPNHSWPPTMLSWSIIGNIIGGYYAYEVYHYDAVNNSYSETGTGGWADTGATAEGMQIYGSGIDHHHANDGWRNASNFTSANHVHVTLAPSGSLDNQ